MHQKTINNSPPNDVSFPVRSQTSQTDLQAHPDPNPDPKPIPKPKNESKPNPDLVPDTDPNLDFDPVPSLDPCPDPDNNIIFQENSIPLTTKNSTLNDNDSPFIINWNNSGENSTVYSNQDTTFEDDNPSIISRLTTNHKDDWANSTNSNVKMVKPTD